MKDILFVLQNQTSSFQKDKINFSNRTDYVLMHPYLRLHNFNNHFSSNSIKRWLSKYNKCIHWQYYPYKDC